VGRIDTGKIVSVGFNGNGLKIFGGSGLDFVRGTFARLQNKTRNDAN
jgi:hypothetical protein